MEITDFTEADNENYGTQIPWDEGTLDKTPCPKCKKKTLYRFAVANGPDDYDWEWRCQNCSFLETS